MMGVTYGSTMNGMRYRIACSTANAEKFFVSVLAFALPIEDNFRFSPMPTLCS